MINLDGIWDFAFLGDVDPDSVDPSAISYTERMAVPGCFDSTPTYAGKRGLAAYRRRVPLVFDPAASDRGTEGGLHRLVFEAVSMWCRVFVAGRRVGEHGWGYSRFAFDFDAADAGEAELVVLVDNRFTFPRCTLQFASYDWYHYGGIHRSVWLRRLGMGWIDDLTVQTVDFASRRVRLLIDYAETVGPRDAEMRIEMDGKPVLAEKVRLEKGRGRIEKVLELPGAALWSPESPNLHALTVRLGDDVRRERIGISQVAVRGRDILINGRPVRLLGVCRHEAHPQFGCAVPPALHVADIQQVKQMGGNFVRGSHYPQDPRFLDLCDEAGLLVWNENMAWGLSAERLTEPALAAGLMTNVDEMVSAAKNHPSVILWGILNECASDAPAARGVYAGLLSRLRELDPTRPVTYASNHIFTDVCYDLADVISINTYPGWYHNEIEEIPSFMDRAFQHLDSTPAAAGKPLIISEIGAAAVPGWRDWNEARWSEQYQSRLLETVIEHLFVKTPPGRVAGLSIWQFCDMRTSEAAHVVLKRARAFNNKGIVDEYRRPKQAFDTVRRLFRSLGA